MRTAGTEKPKKRIVVSAVNLVEGGPLSILLNLANCLDNIASRWQIIYLLHPLVEPHFRNRDYRSFSWPKKSWFFRVFFEKIRCRRVERELQPSLWISLHDMTTHLINTPSVVYCHNPSPFYEGSIWEMLQQPKFLLFNQFYSYLYGCEIHRNKKVIVQQSWIRDEFIRRFKLKQNSVLVAYPLESQAMPLSSNQMGSKVKCRSNTSIKSFIYPAYPRFFKNFEVIGEAARLLGASGYKIYLTISGNENCYARKIRERYGNHPCLEWIGIVDRERLFELYAQSDFLIFPSRLETWGLPLSEFARFGKPILASNRPFCWETLSNYPNAAFFEPTDPEMLASLMRGCLHGQLRTSVKNISPLQPFAKSWNELVTIIEKLANETA